MQKHQSSQNNYKILTTEDGSPTMCLSTGSEPMHSLAGALSETLYIYKPTIEKATIAVNSPHTISVGLGLGYNEILTAAISLQQKRRNFRISSYESVEFLREYFTNWCEKRISPLNSIYDQIASSIINKLELAASVETIKENLSEAILKKRFLVLPALGPQSLLEPANAILFDAFCSKTTAELWTPSFINYFLEKTAQTPCYFSTYACKGDLTRGLKQQSFIVTKTPGFGVKRESTFAERTHLTN